MKKPKYLELALTDDYRISIDKETHEISIKPVFKKDYYRIYVPYNEKSLIYKTFCGSSSPDISILIPGDKHNKNFVMVSYTVSCKSSIHNLLCSFKPEFLKPHKIIRDSSHYIDELAKAYKEILDVENIANLIWLSCLSVNRIIIPIPRYRLGKDRIPHYNEVKRYALYGGTCEEFHMWHHAISEIKEEYEEITKRR